ncbi:MAG: hypothetical protein VB031_00300 [Eubacteriaceae bacterium]|nr:hypothetical protein [Eubacteriaceae bacterium]
MGRKITLVLVSVIVAAAMLLPAGAMADDSKYYTFRTGDTHYMTLNISSGDDVHAALDAACSYVKNNQDGSQYTVVIPAGSYRNTDLTHVYSNTYISAVGATITNAAGDSGPMIRAGYHGDAASRGYSGYKNITIYGGTWDGNGQHISKGFSMFKFGHATNVTMQNMTLKNDKGAHFVEFGGVDGVNVKNCSFSNYINGSGGDGGQEAVQLDINKESVFKNFPTFDDTPCRNITVTGCTFSNVHRGVGSHSATYGSYYDNVDISNNTFKNVTQYAIIGVNFKNAKIMNNKITNAGCGIDFKYMNPKTISKSKYIKGSLNSNAKSVISGNKIDIPKKKMGSNTFGIRIYGEKFKKSKYGLPKKDQRDCK